MPSVMTILMLHQLVRTITVSIITWLQDLHLRPWEMLFSGGKKVTSWILVLISAYLMTVFISSQIITSATPAICCFQLMCPPSPASALHSRTLVRWKTKDGNLHLIHAISPALFHGVQI